jgi:hypothetical protein
MSAPGSVGSGGDDVDEVFQLERKLKIMPFNPKKSDWRIWSKQFLQRAFEKGYRDILLGEVEVVSDDVAKVMSKTDVKYKSYCLNSKAYGDLMMCFTD